MQQEHNLITSELLDLFKKAQRPWQELLEGNTLVVWFSWSRFDELNNTNGIICLRIPVGDEPETTLPAILFRAARQEILKLAPRSRVGGDFGVQKTVELIKQRLHWLKIAKTLSTNARIVQHAIGIRLRRAIVVP